MLRDTPLTDHARARMQQRGIADDALDVLLEFGRERFDHTGHIVVFFDKVARRRLARQTGAAAPRELERLSRAYAVLTTSGTVVTVGHRYRRIPRD